MDKKNYVVRELKVNYRVRKATKAEIEAGYMESINNPRAAAAAVVDLADAGVEKLVVLYLDTQAKIIARKDFENGTVDKAAVYIREIMKFALLTEAASILIAHNHPAGKMTQSMDDAQTYDLVKKAAETLQVGVRDSIIIGRNMESGEIDYHSVEAQRTEHLPRNINRRAKG